jgi:hypothetical protein
MHLNCEERKTGSCKNRLVCIYKLETIFRHKINLILCHKMAQNRPRYLEMTGQTHAKVLSHSLVLNNGDVLELICRLW